MIQSWIMTWYDIDMIIMYLIMCLMCRWKQIGYDIYHNKMTKLPSQSNLFFSFIETCNQIAHYQMYTYCIYKIERNMSEIEVASNNMAKTKNRMIRKINRRRNNRPVIDLRHLNLNLSSCVKAFESEFIWCIKEQDAVVV
jgi:hypothetical protein